jgi:hypothetical protein
MGMQARVGRADLLSLLERAARAGWAYLAMSIWVLAWLSVSCAAWAQDAAPLPTPASSASVSTSVNESVSASISSEPAVATQTQAVERLEQQLSEQRLAQQESSRALDELRQQAQVQSRLDAERDWRMVGWLIAALIMAVTLWLAWARRSKHQSMPADKPQPKPAAMDEEPTLAAAPASAVAAQDPVDEQADQEAMRLLREAWGLTPGAPDGLAGSPSSTSSAQSPTGQSTARQ